MSTMSTTKKRALGVIAVILVIALVVGTVWMGSRPENETATMSKPLVDVQTLSLGSITVQGEYIGTVDPEDIVVLPKVSGEVLSVNVSVGDIVQAGDILCTIDSEALQSQIAQTQAALSSAQAQANLNLSIAEREMKTYDFNVEEGYDSNLISAQAAVDQAKITVKQAETAVEQAELNYRSASRALDDYRDAQEEEENRKEESMASSSSGVDAFVSGLNEQSASAADAQTGTGTVADYSGMATAVTTTSEDSLRDAKAQARLSLENAQNSLQSAKLALQQAEDNLRAVEVLTEQGGTTVGDQVEKARLATNMSDQYIALAQLQSDLADYTVRAAIGGVIEQRSVDPHDMASVQSQMFVITNPNAMAVSFSIPETGLEYMEIGDKIMIDRSGETCEGVITEVSTMVDAQTGLFTVKAAVEKPPFTLHTGSSIKILADVQKAENALVLPIDALYYDGGEPYVYMVKDGKAVKTFVEIGITAEEQVEITGGLSGGEQIIVTWHSGLTDGVEIEIANLDGKPFVPATQTQSAATGTQHKEPVCASEEADK